MGDCSAEVSNEVAPIKVAPHRIELGSLAFGQKERASVPARLDVSGIPSGVQIVRVDCSHAPGVSVSSQSIDHDKVVLNLEINETELCASEPFGAFIKREVRLETNSPTEPQFVVPIIGWMVVNKTPRDFSQFVFQGADRWKGIWPTPNAAGAILAAVALFLVGKITWLQLHLKKDRTWWVWVGLCSLMAALTATLILLGLTYSRGAWLAVLVALGIATFYGPALRKVAGFTAMFFAMVMLFLPSGVQRLESYTAVHDDLSIANRIRLWEGALQMMANNPFAGVGAGRFESVFERDYQSFGHTAKTSTAVSDYLTLGAEHGLLVLSLTLGFLLTTLTLSFPRTVKDRGTVIPTLSAVLVGTLITSGFSTLWVVPDYQWLSGMTVVALMGCVTFLGIRERGVRLFAQHLLIRVSKTTVATLVVLSLASLTSLSLLPTRSSTVELRANLGPSVSYQAFEPRWKATRGIVLFLSDCSHPEVLFHSTIRPMAAMGWKVVALPDSIDSASLHALVASLHQSDPKRNLFVAGDSNGGRFAWEFASQESPDIVRAGGGFNFLSTDLDVKQSGSGPRQPFLVFQSLYSDGVSSNASICAQRKVAFTGLPLTVVLSQEDINHFSGGWMTFLVTLSDFFQHENLYAAQ